MQIPINKLPGISPLFSDYLYDYEKVAEIFNGDFRKIESFRNISEQVSRRNLPRKKLVQILDAQNQKWGCGQRTVENIQKLGENQTCAVVTGQQVGLFSGPLYTIYKSITAIKLAEDLSKKLGNVLVPVFWLATDDHDFAEINHISLFNKSNEIETLKYDDHSKESKLPASEIRLTEKITGFIGQFAATTHDTDFKEKIIHHLEKAYQPGFTISHAFALWMTRLFKDFGLILIDASAREFKEMGKNIFLQEISENSPSTNRALETSERLKQFNYSIQIELNQGILNLFYASPERQSIQLDGDNFTFKDFQQTYPKQSLLELVKHEPHKFSPNVLLRPLFQDAILPTVAYVGGPGEIAYFAQLKYVYEHFQIPMPVLYPRKMVTILENKIEKILRKYEMDVLAIIQNYDKKINEIAKQQVPEVLYQLLSNVSQHMNKDFQAIRKEIFLFDPTLEKTTEITYGKLNQQIQFLEKKILQAARRRSEIGLKQLQNAKLNIHPQNKFQERMFNITPFLIKYDYGFIALLYEMIEIRQYEHQVISI